MILLEQGQVIKKKSLLLSAQISKKVQDVLWNAVMWHSLRESFRANQMNNE